MATPDAGVMRMALEGTVVMPACLPFEEVYRRWADPVYRFCLSQCGDPAAAEDVAADAFTSAYVAYERVRPDPASVHTWLFRIVRNAMVDHHRRRSRWGRLVGVLHRAAPAVHDVETTVALRDELRRTVSAMAELRERDRVLLGLRLAAGLPYAEVAEVMGMSEHAAKVATLRALERLRARVEVER